MKNKPIGIFDSGIGGLTVAKAIKTKMPNQNLIYFGDTAHLPYGEKSPQAIISYSREITKYLISLGCETIIIACNTASSLAYETLKNEFSNNIKLFNVIDPVVESLKQHKNNNIGVIATRATVQSKIYSKKIQNLFPDKKVVEKATPLFANMIEEGFFCNEISGKIIDSYLSDEKLKNVETLILGCTHYPLIQEEIDNYFKNKKYIIDSPRIVADAVFNYLNSTKQINNINEKAHSTFLMSLYTESFEKTAKIFFNKEITFKEFDLWQELKK